MIDLVLRFDDEAQAVSALSRYRQPYGWLLASESHALDPIGPLVLSQPVVDSEAGVVVTPASIDHRYHVNLRVLSGDAPAGLETYTVNPDHPARVWA